MKKLTVTLLLVLACLSIIGQDFSRKEKLDRINTQKIAFITNKLELTSAEAQQFWPVYNEFFREREILNQQKTSVNKELLLYWEEYADDKKTELADQLVQFQLTEAKLEVEYHNKFKNVLPIDKVIKLYVAEKQFKTFLLKQIQNQGGNNTNYRDRMPRGK